MVATVPGIDCEITGGCARVTLCSSDGENRLSAQMVDWLVGILQDPPSDVTMLSLSAEGDAFCLGPQPVAAPQLVRQLGRTLIELNRALMNTRLVTMAVIDARSAGFGVGLACIPDLTIAGGNATFVLPEIEHDLMPAIVLSWLPQLVGEKAATWMALSGLPMNATDAAAAGLVSRSVPSHELAANAADVVDRISSFDVNTVSEVKRFLRARRTLDTNQAELLAVECMGDWAERGLPR